MILAILYSVFATLYLVWAMRIFGGFRKYVRQSRVVAPAKSMRPISVVIAMRNEAENLGILLASLQKLSYAKENFEIIFVDDHSEDASLKVVQAWLAQDFVVGKIVSAKKKGKKEAQYLGICHAKFSWIACTDADCSVPQNWLHQISAASVKADLLFGPVAFFKETDQLQRIEFLALVGSTMAMLANHWAVMGNGANMAFSKALYFEVFATKAHFDEASGDDVFLLHQAKKRNKKVATLAPTVLVKTAGQASIKAFFWQRIRWAQKAPKYQSGTALAVAALVFVINSFLLVGFVGACFSKAFWLPTGLLLGLKLVADFVLIRQFSKAFGQPFGFVIFLIQSLLNFLYVPIVGVFSQVLKYRWKGR